jgi:hypothetical protein
VRSPLAHPPLWKKSTFLSRHELVLTLGDQVTSQPVMPHWVQNDPQDLVVWSFSTKAVYLEDHFTYSEVCRLTVIVED